MTETLQALLHGFSIALTWQNLLWALLGVTLGTVVGLLIQRVQATFFEWRDEQRGISEA
mgnify:CR=1 FL=1